MLIDVECPQCHGHGEVCGVTPSRRSRFVGMDDLSPDDYTRACPRCLGTGVSWNRFRGCWTAQIKMHDVSYNLGGFDRFEDAVEARVRAERANGFTGRQ